MARLQTGDQSRISNTDEEFGLIEYMSQNIKTITGREEAFMPALVLLWVHPIEESADKSLFPT